MNTHATHANCTALLALAALGCLGGSPAGAVEGWGHVGLGLSALGLGATPALAHSAGRGLTVDLAGGVQLARKWQLGIDAGTLIQETTYCGNLCTPAEQQRNRSLDHYLLTVRYVPHPGAGGLFVYGAGGLAKYLDAHATGPGGAAQVLAQQRQGSGAAVEFGVGYRVTGRGNERGGGLVVMFSQGFGRIRPDNRAYGNYAVASTTLSLGYELW